LKQSLKVKQTHKTYDSPRDKLYSIKHHVDYRNNLVHVQKKTKGLLLKNIVGTVKKSYAQNALKGIYGGRHLNLIM
jgi:hypothetical protein